MRDQIQAPQEGKLAIFVQVAIEYGVVASGQGSRTSIGDALDRIARIVPLEYLAVGAGALLLIYLLKR